MRGTTAIPLVFKSAALVANTPPHLASTDSFIPGSFNIYLDIDGNIKPRPGYTPFLNLAQLNARLHGGICYQDQATDFQYIVASNTGWFALVSNVWTDITGTPNVGTDNDPARFAVFFQGGIAWALGVDNASPLRRWNASLATYETVNADALTITSIGEASGSIATVTLASGVTQLAGGDSITIAGNSVTGFNGDWSILQVLSDTQFTFSTGTSSSLGTGTGGTVTDTTIMTPPPARDIAIIANRVVLLNTVEGGVRQPRRVRWSANGDATRWPVLAYLDMLDADDPAVGLQGLGSNLAAAVGERSMFFLQAVQGDDANAFVDSRVYGAQGLPGPVSPAAIVSVEGRLVYFGLDGRVYAFDGSATQPLSANADAAFATLFDTTKGSRAHGVFLVEQRLVLFFVPCLQPGNPTYAEVVDLNQSPPSVIVPQFFSEEISGSFPATLDTGLTWGNSPYTWANVPYTWEQTPGGQELAPLIETAGGEVDELFTGATDGANAYAIPWAAALGYFHAPSALQKLILNQAEFWLVPNGQTAPLHSQATAVFTSLTYPFDEGNVLVSFTLMPGYNLGVAPPGAASAGNTRSNFVSLALSGVSDGQTALAGGIVYFYLDTKGNYTPLTTG